MSDYGPAERAVRAFIQMDAVADALLDQLKAEWAEASNRPDHECSFDLEGDGCRTCGIPYEEWIRLDR